MMDLGAIVKDLGGHLHPGGRTASVPGPGHSRRDRSLSLRLSEDGDRVIYHSFSGDTHADILRHLKMERGSARPISPQERRREQLRRDHERRMQDEADQALCQHIWSETVAIENTPAETYLWRRSLIAEGQTDLRFHPAAPLSKAADCEAFQPAMIALVRSLDGAPAALHLTFLKPDGSDKAFKDRSRRMYGPVSGNAVRLGAVVSERVLAVAEGVETAGSYSTLFGVPAWAALSTTGLEQVRLPYGLRKLVIAADGDKPGMKAATVLAERAARICDVEIHAAPDGQDWNDVLREHAA